MFILFYPIVVILDFFTGLQEIFSLKSDDRAYIEDHEQMSKSEIGMYATIYLAVIGLHIPLVMYAAHISNFGLAAELLK